jgi:hypothetical protein
VLKVFPEYPIMGLWAGLSCGPMASVIVQGIIQARTDWAEQSHIAQERARTRTKARAAAKQAKLSSTSPALRDDE